MFQDSAQVRHLNRTGFMEEVVYVRDTIERKVPRDSMSPGSIQIFRDVLSRASLFVCLPTHLSMNVTVPPRAGKRKFDAPSDIFTKHGSIFLVPLYFLGFETNSRFSARVPLGDFRTIRITMRDAIRFSEVCNKHPCSGFRAIRWLS